MKLVEIGAPNTHLEPEVQIARIVTKEFESATQTTIIAVGGPGGVGKSSFASKLQMEIPDSVVIRLDDYRIEREERKVRQLSPSAPEANNIELLQEHLATLKRGFTISKPRFNHVSGTCDSIDEIIPAPYIILDGEIATYEQFANFVDFSIYIDAHWKTQLKTSTERDISQRGDTVQSAISNFLKSNLEEFHEYGAGTKEKVDLVLWCESDYSLSIHGIRESLKEKYADIVTRPDAEVSLEKVFVAATTPFRRDMSIDFKAFASHLRYMEKEGVEAIFVGGTTGEFDALTFDEKVDLLRAARKAFTGVITFNVSSTSLKEALQLVKAAEENGANAITALPPYYRAEVGNEGISAFFKTIAESTSLPFILYNFTRHTQNEITADIVKESGVGTVKDSDKNLSLISDVSLYLCAGDSIIAEAVNRGANGVVSVQGNYRPWEIVHFFRVAKTDHYHAEKMQHEVAAVSALFRKNKQIARIKCAVSELIPGYPTYVRLPLIPLLDDEEQEIRSWCKTKKLPQ